MAAFGEKMAVFQVNEKCTGCLACVQNCPAKALSFEDHGARRSLLHNLSLCARCGHCWRICPEKAIEFEHLLVGQWERFVSLDLVVCSVCGEPIYTTGFERSVSNRLKKGLEPLCPRHRSSATLTSWHRALRTGEPLEEVPR